MIDDCAVRPGTASDVAVASYRSASTCNLLPSALLLDSRSCRPRPTPLSYGRDRSRERSENQHFADDGQRVLAIEARLPPVPVNRQKDGPWRDEVLARDWPERHDAERRGSIFRQHVQQRVGGVGKKRRQGNPRPARACRRDRPAPHRRGDGDDRGRAEAVGFGAVTAEEQVQVGDRADGPQEHGLGTRSRRFSAGRATAQPAAIAPRAWPTGDGTANTLTGNCARVPRCAAARARAQPRLLASGFSNRTVDHRYRPDRSDRSTSGARPGRLTGARGWEDRTRETRVLPCQRPVALSPSGH